MKKISSLLLIGIIFTQTVFSQAEKRPRLVEVSFFGGPTIMWASTKTPDYKRKGARIGGVYGAGIDINLAQPLQNYYFTTGITARHIRSTLSFPDNYHVPYSDKILDSSIVKATYNAVYVTIPTAIKLKTDPFGRFIIYGTVGLDHGVCVSSKNKDEVTNKAKVETYKKVDMYKKTLFFREALIASVGFDFIIKGNTKATFAFVFNNAFTNSYRKTYTNNISGEKVSANTRGFEFQFGFIF